MMERGSNSSDTVLESHTHSVGEPSHCTSQANVKIQPIKATQGAPHLKDADPATVVAFWFDPVQSFFLLEGN